MASNTPQERITLFLSFNLHKSLARHIPPQAQTPPKSLTDPSPSSFGIPPQFKRELENKALETMGENKASYMAKSYVDKIPASDQEDVREVKKGVGNAVGGALQNPLGGLVS